MSSKMRIGIAVLIGITLAACAPQVQDSAGKVLDSAGTVVQPGLQKVWEPSPGAPPLVTEPESKKARGQS